MHNEKSLGNRQEVSALVESGDTQSLQDIKHEQLKVRSQREELGHTIEDFSKITGLSY